MVVKELPQRLVSGQRVDDRQRLHLERPVDVPVEAAHFEVPVVQDVDGKLAQRLPVLPAYFVFLIEMGELQQPLPVAVDHSGFPGGKPVVVDLEFIDGIIPEILRFRRSQFAVDCFFSCHSGENSANQG